MNVDAANAADGQRDPIVEHIVGNSADVPEGAHIVVEVNGREIGLFNVRGHYYALLNHCFHQNGPVCRGAVSGTLDANAETGWQKVWTREGEIVICPWHALEFSILTGECLAFPDKRVPRFPVKVEDGFIKLTV